MKNGQPRRVLFVKPLIKQYRKPFFERLQAVLAPHEVELQVVYSTPSKTELKKGDNIDLPPPLGRKVQGRYFLRERALCQWPGLREIARADLVILVNANRNLLNLPLLLLSALRLKTVALWGHGRNHQQEVRGTAREWFKQRMAKMPDWWFAYSRETAAYLASIGVEVGRITTINNAIDTSSFAAMVSAAGEGELVAMRDRLGLAADDYVALYCGALYSHKRIPLLLESCAKVAAKEPRFRLLIVGGGAEADNMRHACQDLPFLRYAGPLFGKDKALCYKLSSVILNPGAVGLAVLDAFAAGRPFITLADSLHGPEIGYLEHGLNGLLVKGDADAFADAVTAVIDDGELRARLAAGAEQAAARYTVEAMVERVRRGILDCLERTERRP